MYSRVFMENTKQCPLCKQESRGGNYHDIVNMKMVSAKTIADGWDSVLYSLKWVCQNEKCGFILNENDVGSELFTQYCDIKNVTSMATLR